MATELTLSQGLVAVVDDADAVSLGRWKWSAARCHGSKVVAVRREGRRTIYMHRQILGLAHGDPREADHINFDTLDNRRGNLQVVTAAQNKIRVPSRGGSSHFVGVTWDEARGRWRAQVQVAGTVINLGRYASEHDAAAARDAYVVAHDTGHLVNGTVSA